MKIHFDSDGVLHLKTAQQEIELGLGWVLLGVLVLVLLLSIIGRLLL